MGGKDGKSSTEPKSNILFDQQMLLVFFSSDAKSKWETFCVLSETYERNVFNEGILVPPSIFFCAHPTECLKCAHPRPTRSRANKNIFFSLSLSLGVMISHQTFIMKKISQKTAIDDNWYLGATREGGELDLRLPRKLSALFRR
jgi:hypothetical protein